MKGSVKNSPLETSIEKIFVVWPCVHHRSCTRWTPWLFQLRTMLVAAAEPAALPLCKQQHTHGCYYSRRLNSNHLRHVCDSVCVSVCPHDKTKTAESKIAKLGTGIVHHDTSSTNEYYVQRSKVKVSCWTRTISTDSENPPVCLLLAFRWQCVRCVFTYSRYTNVHLLTYLLTQGHITSRRDSRAAPSRCSCAWRRTTRRCRVAVSSRDDTTVQDCLIQRDRMVGVSYALSLSLSSAKPEPLFYLIHLADIDLTCCLIGWCVSRVLCHNRHVIGHFGRGPVFPANHLAMKIFIHHNNETDKPNLKHPQ